MDATSASDRKIVDSCKRRRWKFRFAAVALASFAALCLVEVGLWLFSPLTSSEWLHWRADGHIKGIPEPNQALRTASGGHVRTNRLGYRGPNYTWKPAPGTLRLAAFGGSSTFGADTGNDNTWPYLLQRRLSVELGMPVEVINLGLPGFDTLTSTINYLQAGRALNPHVVLLYHTWNDIKFFRPLQRGPLLHSKVVPNKSWWFRALRHTQLARRLARLRGVLRDRAVENHYTSMEAEGAGAAAPVQPEAIRWARQNYVDFVSLAQADGRLAVLITQATVAAPTNINQPEYRRRIRVDYVGMTVGVVADTWLKVNATIEEVASTYNTVFVDGYGAVPHDLDHMTDHVHMTVSGRRALANAIAGRLLDDQRFMDLAEEVRQDQRPHDKQKIHPDP